MTVVDAKQRLFALLDGGGSLTAATAEANAELAHSRETVSAAAHALATELGIITGEEPDPRGWFPYNSLLTRTEP